jgi:hypothetical protein
MSLDDLRDDLYARGSIQKEAREGTFRDYIKLLSAADRQLFFSAGSKSSRAWRSNFGAGELWVYSNF